MLSNFSSSQDAINRQIDDIAGRHKFSGDAARAVMQGLVRSGGSMSQFNHPELGGMGQWSSGMLMIGDFSDANLKERVRALCSDLSNLAAGCTADEVKAETSSHLVTPFDNIQWWPENLGVPSSAGSQNQTRYAYFPDVNRLAIERDRKVTIYDTGSYRIFGVSQSQGGRESLTFESQHGSVSILALSEVSSDVEG